MEKELNDMDYGEKGVIKEIEEELKMKLSGMGVREGKGLIFKTRHPINGPVVIEVEGSTTSMGAGLAGKITVEVEE